MQISEAWTDIYHEGYIHQFQPDLTHKIHYQHQKHQAERYPSMGQLHLLNINMDENIYKSIVQHLHNSETLR